jgi:hypothetical protein
LTADSKFGSTRALNQWLCYEFKHGAVLPNGYSIRSQFNGSAGAFHPKSWAIEVSDSGSEWTAIDRRANNNELNDRNVTRYFSIGKELSEPCHFIRLRQTGLNHAGNDELWLSSFEIFGDFFESKTSSHTK